MKTHIGSSFDEFLAEEAMLEDVSAVAAKRVIFWQIAQAPDRLDDGTSRRTGTRLRTGNDHDRTGAQNGIYH